MNWLMYLGGGLVFLRIVGAKMNISDDIEIKCYADAIVKLIAVVSTWVWVCLKFIAN